MAAPRILTFNFHEPYLCLMAKTGFPFTVGLYRDPPLARVWQTKFRPIPPNIALAEEEDWRADLDAGLFDIVVAHNETNAANILPAIARRHIPTLLVCHNRRSFLETTIREDRENNLKKYKKLLERLQDLASFIFISQSKKDDYGIGGKVILPGIDVEEYGGYTGETAEVLRVGNMMRARDLMFDVDFQEQVCAGFPHRVTGMDPAIPGATPSTSLDDLLHQYRSLRCLLHVTREDYEDGYNLAMIEAMACGMPVVSLANRTSPVTDGVDGYVSYQAEVLRDRIQTLLKDRDLAIRIGAEGRRTVATKFPIRRFVDQWRETLEETAERSPRRIAAGRATKRVVTPVSPENDEAAFEPGGYFRCPRPELISQIPRDARRVLDCGCGAGEFGRLLKQAGVQEVVGVEIVERAWKLAKQVLDDAILGNLETMDLPFEDGYFDCICFNDVLEHLVDPASALRNVSRVLAPDGLIIMSIPNVRFYETVDMLANGRWQYSDAGILDRTHLRFFTSFEMLELVSAAGLEPLILKPLSAASPEQLPRSPDGSLKIGRVTVHNVTDSEHADFLTYQYVLIAVKPETDRLDRARRFFEQNDPEAAYACARDATDVDEGQRKRVMAEALTQLGKQDEAAALYREALTTKPDNDVLAANLGVLLVTMNRCEEARPYLERALEAVPDNDQVLGSLGLVYGAEGNPSAAFDCLKRALDANFDNEVLLSRLVETAQELDRLADAESYVRRFVDYYQGNIEMTYTLARILSRLGKHAEALERLETILLLSPGHEAATKLLEEIRESQS